MDGIVDVKGLWKTYGGSGILGRFQPRTPVLEDINFSLQRGELAALVGESGSGKTTIGRCLLGLVPFERGTALVNGYDVSSLKGAQEKAFRMSAQLVFQNPYASLNPAFRTRSALAEAVMVHNPGLDKAHIDEEVDKLSQLVQLPVERLNEFPTSLSGGERRRVVFARALAAKPKFVVTDEPVSGLDQPIQAQLLDLMRRVVIKHNTTMMFISHDLRLVKFIATRVIVLHRGRIVEDAPADRFFCDKGPLHPYSQELLLSAFSTEKKFLAQSQVRPPDRGTGGCSFRSRCNFASIELNSNCATKKPDLFEAWPGHRVACHWCRECAV